MIGPSPGQRLEWLASAGVAAVVAAMASGGLTAVVHRGIRGLGHLDTTDIRYLTIGSGPASAFVLLLCVVAALFAGSEEALSASSRRVLVGAMVAAPVLIVGATLFSWDLWRTSSQLGVADRLDEVIVSWLLVVVAASGAGVLAAQSLGAAAADAAPAGSFSRLRGRWRHTV